MCCIFLLHNGTRQGGNVAKGCLRRDAKCAAKEARREGDAPRYEIATPGGGHGAWARVYQEGKNCAPCGFGVGMDSVGGLFF
jgi:hypothetical protein